MRSALFCMLAGAGALLSSCSTMVNGTTQRIELASDPPGAAVKVDGIPIGNTPTSIDLKRGSSHFVTVEKTGYAASDETIEQHTSWWFAGNILLGGIIGMIVDYSTGGMYNLAPATVSPVLIASAPQPSAAGPVAESTPAAMPQSASTPGASPAQPGTTDVSSPSNATDDAQKASQPVNAGQAQ